MFDPNQSYDSTNRNIMATSHPNLSYQPNQTHLHPAMMTDLNIFMQQARHFSSQKKSEMLMTQKRKKNLQWLTKWDEFRKQKSVFVERALEILKHKRRVINLITLMALVEKVTQMRDNYHRRKEYMRAQFSAMMVAIKCKVRYQRVF